MKQHLSHHRNHYHDLQVRSLQSDIFCRALRVAKTLQLATTRGVASGDCSQMKRLIASGPMGSCVQTNGPISVHGET